MRYFAPMAALIVLAVAGCAHPDTKVWSHPTATEAQTGEDLRVCRRTAENRAGLRTGDNMEGRRSSDVLGSYDNERLRRQIDGDINNCMTSKGYNFAPPASRK